MSDTHEDNVREIPARPARPPETGHKDYVSEDTKLVANTLQQKRLIEFRTAARMDAMVMLDRARARVGIDRANWSHLEADTLHALTDLLLQVQGQEVKRA